MTELTQSPNSSEQKSELGSEGFVDIRREVAERFFNDPSYDVFDAMHEMTTAAEEFVDKVALSYPDDVLWVGGSLGRGEMLPNSDIDLFVIYDDEEFEPSDIRIDGVDKFEIGHISKGRLFDLLQYSFIDANRFIDGRKVGHVDAPDVERMILEVNTPDRQLANNISEYFYYRYFDFNQKTTDKGPNLKYSTGSSRDTIFFNMISRMYSGNFPATRGNTPELPEVVLDAEERFGVKPPMDTINMLFTVKNVAISVFDASGDERSKYVSHPSLEAIYSHCPQKFQALGYSTADEFIEGYKSARKELELAVDTLFTQALDAHPARNELETILKLDNENIQNACLEAVNGDGHEYPQSVISLSAWLMLRNNAPPEDMAEITKAMTNQPIDKVWGGLMAVVCSGNTPDETLSELTDWLFENEKGAYLLKLITRNPASSPATKDKALDLYHQKEIIL